MRAIRPKGTSEDSTPQAPTTTRTAKGAAPLKPSCKICRERKTKCDRAEPKCGRCERLGELCGYNALPARGALPRQILQLQARLARAEARLALSHQEDPSTVTIGAEITSMDLLSQGNAQDMAIDSPWFHGPMRSNLAPQFTSSPRASFYNPSPSAGFEDPFYGDGNMQAYGNAGFHGEDEVAIPTEGLMLESMNIDDDWFNALPSVDPTLSTEPTIQTSNEEPLTQLDQQPVSLNQCEPFELKPLHDLYFDNVSDTFTMIYKDRFYKDVAASAASHPTKALSYAVALLGAVSSPEHAQWRDQCYKSARDHLDECERSDEGSQLADLNTFQAMVLLIRYEIMGKRLTRAWMTLGRALRLAKVLNLHHLDNPQQNIAQTLDMCVALPPTDDEALLEERRRSFWALFILESYVTTRSSLPSQLGPAHLYDVKLPSKGDIIPSFQPDALPPLRDVSHITPNTPLSAYACGVLMVDTAIKCFDHGRSSPGEEREHGFWDRHYALVKEMDERIAMLTPRLADLLCTNPLALSTYMNLCSIEIFLHNAAVKQVEERRLPGAMASDSHRRCTAAALKISSTVRILQEKPKEAGSRDLLSVQATFLAWPLVMAMTALSHELESEGSVTRDNSTADQIHLLLTTLDHVEDQGNFWHTHTEGVSTALQRWDSIRLGFEPNYSSAHADIS